MKPAVSLLVVMALLLGACDSSPAPDQADAAQAEPPNPEIAWCKALTSASKSGDISMRAAFVSTPTGRDIGGGVIKELTDAGKYKFLGGEMVGSACYAYAEARGEQFGRMFNLAWRCPAKLIVDNPAEPGKTMLEVVEDRECDYGVERGAPATRETGVELIHM